MRRILAAALALVLALMLCACKSAEAKSVEAQIGQIGDVTLESAAAIEEAEASFAALTEEQKAEVKNYDVLLAARETYTGLKSEAAKRTEALIDAIGEVTADSRSAIEQAQAAYDALSAQEREQVENNAALQAAHERFAALKSAAVLELEARIGALGAVTLDSESAVEQAEAAFAALPEEEQRQVENQAVLLAARETLDAAKQELEAHYAVIEGKVGSDGTGYLPRMDGTMLEIRGDVVALWLLKDRKTAVILERDGTLYTLAGEEKQTLAAEVSSVQTVRSSGVLYLDGEGYLYRQLFDVDEPVRLGQNPEAITAETSLTTLFVDAEKNLYLLKEDAQEPEKISQCTQDGASVELEAVTDDGGTAIWMEVNKTDKKSSVYLYETGDRSLLGEVDSAYSSTYPAFSADGALLAVGNTSASTLWFQKSGGEVVKAKLGGTLSSAALYTKDGRLDESTGDADGLYALVKASDSSSAYFITLDGDREKIVSDIRAFQIANGKICYLTTDKDLYLADIDGAQATDAVKLAGEVVDFDIAADGETVYYVKNFEEKEKSASLYRYSVAQGEAEKLSSEAYTLGLWGLYYSCYSLSSDGKTVFFFEQMQSIGDTYSTSGVLKCAAVGSGPVQVSTDIMVSLESGLLNGSIDPKHVMLEKYISLDEEKNILVNWMYFDGTQAQALAKEIYHSYTGKTVLADPPAQEDAE